MDFRHIPVGSTGAAESGKAAVRFGAFARQLVKLRQEAGFPSAYQFYHRNGGRRHFPFTYVHYLRIDKGIRLPKPHWMPCFLSGLRLTPGEGGCRELFLGYLRDLVLTEEAFALIVAPLLEQQARPEASIAQEALRWIKTEHAVHLTPEQFKAQTSTDAAYWCAELLVNDRGTWSAAELANLLGLEAAPIRAALKKLKDVGIAREVGEGRYASRHEGKVYTYPGRLKGLAAYLDQVEGFWDKMYAKRGKETGTRVELVRADESAMRRYFQVLAQTLDSANLYSRTTKGDDSGLFVIEASVKKVLPF
ncbi:MAG: hypothetical protein HY553_00020 [Elusimicrobia bacterium]|nr:hypothetical protein [Elusimicrobiota bacterium]